jgi:nickel/cobalt transporter (NicO) family protein
MGYFALLAGLGSGALHALSGPDHLLSLVPLSVGRRQGAWRLGMLWGVGHGLGTLAAVAVLIAVVQATHLQGLERWAERVAALALLVTGAWGLRRRAADAGEDAAPVRRGVLGVGLVHGLTGAAALLLLLPAAVSGTAGERVLYVGGFSVGSTLAMAALTAALAALSQVRRLPAALGERVPRVASALSMGVGGAWIAASLS